ncbi:MAG: DUF3822 family protein [Prevotellaceae bacterium]|jgi:hypothetical protein|nr:DUF3822 family protein [Prevotellaceae bacterium]
MTPITVVDGAFDALSARLHLSVQGDLHKLCYCLLDLDRRRYVALRVVPYPIDIVDYNDLHKAVQLLLAREALLNVPLQSVSCCYVSRSATLLPNELYDAVSLKQLLEFCAPLNELDELHSGAIVAENAQAIFAIPSPLADLLARKYSGNVQFFHQCLPLLNAVPAQHGDNELLAVSIHHDFADIAFFAQQQLKLYNTFALQSPHDLLYFLLAIARQHNLNADTVSVVLAGDVGGYAPTLVEFFPILIQAKPHTTMDFAEALKPYADHRFACLFSLYQCAS